MLIELLLLLFSLFLLHQAADYLVQGVAALSQKLRISEAVIGASVAAVGSSAPEFGAATFAVINNEPSFGTGTIIGSAIFNMTVIIGLSAVVGKIVLDRRVVTRDVLFYLIAILLVIGSLFDGVLTRAEALVWLGAFVIYLVWLVRDARIGAPVPDEDFGDISQNRAAVYVLISIVLLGVSAHLLLNAVISLSNEFGVTTAGVSLIVVAVGTSIPDLFTSIDAAGKGLGSLAVANAVGSNIFDILGAIGIPYAFRPSTAIGFDVGLSTIVLLISIIAFLFVLRQTFTVTKREGVGLLVIYGAYLALLLVPLSWVAV